MKNIISKYQVNFSATLLVAIFFLSFSSCKTSQKEVSTVKKGELTAKDKMNFDYLFFNANKEKILGNFDLAETYFIQALKIDQNNAAALYEVANIYSFQKEKTKALVFSKKAASIEPTNVW